TKPVPDKEAETPHVHKPTFTTSSYRASAPGKLPLVSKAPRWLLGSLPVPPGVQVARLAVDVGAAGHVRLGRGCSGSTDAREAAEVLQAGLYVTAGSLLAMAGECRLSRDFADPQEMRKKWRVLLDLLTPVEKAMARAAATVKGKTAILCVRIPVDCKQV